MFDSWFRRYRQLCAGRGSACVRFSPAEVAALRTYLRTQPQVGAAGMVWVEPQTIRCTRPSLVGEPLGWELVILPSGEIRLQTPPGTMAQHMDSAVMEITYLLARARDAAA